MARRPGAVVLAIAGPGLTGASTTVLTPIVDRTIDGKFVVAF